MRRLDVSAATGKLADYVRRLDEEPLVIADGDQVLAVLIATKNSDWETVSLSLKPKFHAIIERSRRRRQKEGGTELEAIMDEFGLTQADLDAIRQDAQAVEGSASTPNAAHSERG
jgi:hypothetical protein